MRLIENIMAWLKTVADEQKVTIAEIKLDFDQVISGTGPSAFTRAILADLSERTGRDIGWDSFHDLDESKLVGNLLVLNVEAFAAGQGHSDAGNHDTRHALVKHHYHASHWPEAHPRFSHPMFGEVEQCNWKPDCVKKWDEDTAAWEKLPAEEQNKQLALKAMEANQEKAENQPGLIPDALPNIPPNLPPNMPPNMPPSAPFLEGQPNMILKRGLEGEHEHDGQWQDGNQHHRPSPGKPWEPTHTVLPHTVLPRPHGGNGPWKDQDHWSKEE